MSNYPPGVTGNEYEIAGLDDAVEEHYFCPRCHTQVSGWREFYGGQSRRYHEVRGEGLHDDGWEFVDEPEIEPDDVPF